MLPGSPLSKTSCALLFMALLVFFVSGCEQKKTPKSKGGTDFTLSDSDGNMVTLSDFKGKVVLLEFFTTWCPPCKIATPDLIELNKKLQGRDFMLLAISIKETPETVNDYIKEEGVNFTVLLDDKDVNENYGVRNIPTAFILDKQGMVVSKYMGYTKGMADSYLEEIEELLK